MRRCRAGRATLTGWRQKRPLAVRPEAGLGKGCFERKVRVRPVKGVAVVTTKQTSAARKNLKKAAKVAAQKRTIASMPRSTRRALGKQGAAVARRKRTGGSLPRTKAELYEDAKRLDIPGRSKMGREQLQRALKAAR